MSKRKGVAGRPPKMPKPLAVDGPPVSLAGALAGMAEETGTVLVRRLDHGSVIMEGIEAEVRPIKGPDRFFDTDCIPETFAPGTFSNNLEAIAGNVAPPLAAEILRMADILKRVPLPPPVHTLTMSPKTFAAFAQQVVLSTAGSGGKVPPFRVEVRIVPGLPDDVCVPLDRDGNPMPKPVQA